MSKRTRLKLLHTKRLPRIGFTGGEPFRMRIGSQMMLVCCECSLRHLVTIAQGPKMGEVVVRFDGDDSGTKALREVARLRKKPKKRKGKK